jgi:hypothetical protein
VLHSEERMTRNARERGLVGHAYKVDIATVVKCNAASNKAIVVTVRHLVVARELRR